MKNSLMTLNVDKSCREYGWRATVVSLSEFNASICTDRNMSLPLIRSSEDNFNLNLFISTYIFNRFSYNLKVARSLGLFWFDQAVLLDAVLSIETGFEWQTFSGQKLNFTKWTVGRPQVHDGVTFSMVSTMDRLNSFVCIKDIVEYNLINGSISGQP